MKDADKDNSYAHVLKYTGIFGGVQGLNIVVGIVRNKLVALLLGPAGMGLAALYTSVVNFLSQSTSLGISFSAVRHLSELSEADDDESRIRFVRVVRAWSIVAALLGMLVCVALGPLLSREAFSGGDHTLHFLLLSPVIGMMALTGGETAILKGCHRLQELAVVQVLSVLASLLISVPVYWCFGISGIVPVIALIAFAVMVSTLFFSFRLYPLRLRGSLGVLGEGMEMIRLGVAFIVSGIFTSGGEMVVRSFLNVAAGADVVGLYNAGYILTITYAGLVFSAMETDYFPRLSAVNHDRAAANLTANRQIEVSLLLIAPMLAFFIAALPLLIPLLYSGKFAPVVPMARLAVLSMYLKAVTLPVAYMTLARGHSLAYLLLEAAYAVVLVLFIMFGFDRWGLVGTGVALLAAHVFDFLMIYVYAGVRYGYRVSRPVLLYSLAQMPLGVGVYLTSYIRGDVLSLVAGCCIAAASLIISVAILYKKTSLWNRLKEKSLFKRRFFGNKG